ncbi:MAG: MDR family MFS transporter, partial [Micrococcaceae bacterium]
DLDDLDNATDTDQEDQTATTSSKNSSSTKDKKSKKVKKSTKDKVKKKKEEAPLDLQKDSSGNVVYTHQQRLVIIASLMIAMTLAMLDQTIVGPALPTIVGDLGGLEHLSWVTTAYVLASTVSTPLFGKLGDIYSRKIIFMTSIIIFLIGSMAAGLSNTMGELIAARAFQGLGGGGLMVNIMATMAAIVPPRERGKYSGYMMAVMPAAMIGGPLIGGYITDHYSWHWIFYINLPLGLIAITVIAKTLKLAPSEKAGASVDWLGAFLLSVWITCLVLMTSWGGSEYDWNSAMIWVLGIGIVVFFSMFVYSQTIAKEPVMPLYVFKNANYTLAVILSFLVGFGLLGAMTFLPQYQQFVQGQSATNSGFLMMPMMLTAMAMSLISGQVVARTGKYKIFPILGTLFMVGGLYLFSTMDINTSRFTTGLYMAILGLGMGMLMQITTTIAQNSVKSEDLGAATGASTFMRNMGSSLGLSILGSVYTQHMVHYLQDHLKALGPAATAQMNMPGGSGLAMTPKMLDKMPPPMQTLFKDAVVNGSHNIYLWAAAIMVVGFVVSLFIKQIPLRGTGDAKDEAEIEMALADEGKL